MTIAVEPKEATIEAAGLRFHYVEWGEKASLPMVLLHGLTSAGRIWDPVAQALQGRYRVLAPDQRGHGESTWPEEPEYATDDFVGDISALAGAWGIGRFVLAGLSMGGVNAMAYAARHPERVTHLVVIDVPPYIDRERNPTQRQIDRHVAEHGHLVLEDHDAALKVMRLTNHTTPDERARHRLRYTLKQTADGKWTYKHDPRVSYHWQPADLWEELPKIQAPVLIVRGGKTYVFSERTAARMQQAFPNAELVNLPEAGHTVPEDRPEEFIEALESFLARHPAPV